MGAVKMIKLQRPPEPQKLIDNKAAWQQNLNASIAKYGSYKKIPEDEREKLIRHYKDDAVKTPLFESSHQKCAYCECNATEGGYMEVDHFRAKSIYPESVFEWNNLLPSCRQCNGIKWDHDTGDDPIINPYEVDPEDAFYYKRIQIKPRDGIYFATAKKTIDVCRLNRETLLTSRSKILPKLEKSCIDIETAITEYNKATTDIEKKRYLRNIREALSTVESIQQDTETYAGFCRHFFKHDDIFQKAKEIIAA
jgi:uncharacterized protein (TIGR02646 family)